jgi:hypothetical protein
MAGMVLAAVLVLVGAFVLYRGVREMLHIRRLRRQGRQVVGTVTGHQRRSSGTRSVIVSYIDERGTAQQIISSLSATSPTIGVGEPATVRYLPGDPGSAWIDERRENLRSALLTLVIGFGFASAGVFLAFDR